MEIEEQAEDLEMSEEQKKIRSQITSPSTLLKIRPNTGVSKDSSLPFPSDSPEQEYIFYTSEIKISVNPGGKFINEFKILSTIGNGSYSKVKHVIRQFTDEDQKEGEEDYAMKMIHKPTLQRARGAIFEGGGKFEMSNMLEKVFMEIDIWSRGYHENVVRLYEFIEADGHDYGYIIIELGDLGQIANWDFKQELYKRTETIVNFLSNDKEFENENQKVEYVAKRIFKDVTSGIEYLHSRKFVHRDIKPDNILVSARDAKAKISDFSVSGEVSGPEERGFNSEGTIAFTAPETHIPDQDGFLLFPTDIWSIGVCLYTYLAERVPFYAESELEMQINAQKQEVGRLEDFSDEVNDIISKMTEKDPEKRPTASDLLAHPWFEDL